MSGAGQHGLQDWKADLICGHWKTHKPTKRPPFRLKSRSKTFIMKSRR